jgi:hypothetical protein
MKNIIIKQISDKHDVEIFLQEGVLNINSKNEDFKFKINSEIYSKKNITYLDGTGTARSLTVFAKD